MSETDTAPSKFERIGGAATVDRLVEAFYSRMDALPEAQELRSIHAPDLSATKLTLKKYLTEWLGGPDLYSAENGHPRLRRRHLHLKIGEAERDAWLLCMTSALAATVADAELRAEIYEPMAKLADWMRNQPDNPHDARKVLSGDCS